MKRSVTPPDATPDLAAPPAAEDQPYFAALGLFVSYYAMAETAVHLIARLLSGASDQKARVIFSGMRLSDLTDRIRHLMEADDIRENYKDEVRVCLAQLNVLAEMRNRLVHRLVTYAAQNITATNLFTSRSLSKVETTLFSIGDLVDMRIDCFCIYARLRLLIEPTFIDDSPDLKEVVVRPWRYKPSPPNSSARPRPKAPRSNQLRRSSSPQ